MNNSFTPNNLGKLKTSFPREVEKKSSAAVLPEVEPAESYENDFPSASVQSDDIAMNNRLLVMSDLMAIEKTKMDNLKVQLEEQQEKFRYSPRSFPLHH